MAYLIGKDKGFVHIPKTGGRTIADYLSQRDDFRSIYDLVYGKHSPVESDMGIEFFICVRRPDKWLASFHNQAYKYGFKIECKGTQRYAPIKEIHSLLNPDIDKFIENVIESNGSVGRVFDSYMKHGKYFVGRTEHLQKDFSEYMGEKIKLSNEYKSGIKFPRKYLNAINESERELIEKYYANQ